MYNFFRHNHTFIIYSAGRHMHAGHKRNDNRAPTLARKAFACGTLARIYQNKRFISLMRLISIFIKL
jgi:hypothetical protein